MKQTKKEKKIDKKYKASYKLDLFFLLAAIAVGVIVIFNSVNQKAVDINKLNTAYGILFLVSMVDLVYVIYLIDKTNHIKDLGKARFKNQSQEIGRLESRIDYLEDKLYEIDHIVRNHDEVLEQ